MCQVARCDTYFFSYKLINPIVLPGILQGLIIPGWDIEKSFYSYRSHSYSTSFGLKDYQGLTNFPELYFNIYIKHQIIGPIVSYMMPNGLVLVMVFSILLLTSRHEQKTGLFGFNTMNVITACAGFCIVVVFSHIDLRESLVANDLIYMEYFYFNTYLFILYVAFHSLIFVKMEHRIVHYKDNLIPQILYWPVNQFNVLLFTLFNFY